MTTDQINPMYACKKCIDRGDWRPPNVYGVKTRGTVSCRRCATETKMPVAERYAEKWSEHSANEATP